MDEELHSLQRRLIELRMEHADLDAMIDRLAEQNPLDELALRDMLARLEAEAAPDEPA